MQEVVRSRWFAIGCGVALFVVALVLPLFRETGLRTWEHLFSEDGSVYSQQAIRSGGVAVLFRGYGGYLQLPARLLAVLTPVVPRSLLAIYLTGAGALVSALLAWFAYYASASILSSRPVRLAVASLVVLMDVLAWEVTGNITNTIWVFLAVLPLALLCTRDTRRDVAICAAVAFFAATSTALAALFVPFAIGAAMVRRTRSRWTVCGAFAVGLAIQTLVVLTAKDTAKGGLSSSGRQLVELLGARVPSVFLVGTRASTRGSAWWGSDGHALMIGSTLVVVALFAVLLVGAARRERLLAGVFAAYAVVTFAVPVWGRGTATVLVFGGPSMGSGATRFSVVPVMMLSLAFAVLVAPRGVTRSRLAARIGRPVFIIHVLVLSVIGFSVTNGVSTTGLDWRATLDQARSECAAKSPDDEVVLPTIMMDAFAVTLRCRDLAD